MSKGTNTVFVFTAVGLAQWDADRDLRKSSTNRLVMGWARIRPFITGCVSGGDQSAGHLTAYLSTTCNVPYETVTDFSADQVCPDPTREVPNAAATAHAITRARSAFVELPDRTLVVAHMGLLQALGREIVLPHRLYVARIEGKSITAIGLIGDDDEISIDELLHTLDPELAAKSAPPIEPEVATAEGFTVSQSFTVPPY